MYFLCFVTDTSALVDDIFNSFSGLACRPIAHTCSNTLELQVDAVIFFLGLFMGSSYNIVPMY